MPESLYRPSLYTQRCNDLDERRKWQESGLVKLSSLANGELFECIDGYIYRKGRIGKCCTIHAEPSGRSGEPELPTEFIEHALVRTIN